MQISIRCARALVRGTGQTAFVILLLAGGLANDPARAANPPASYAKILASQVITDAVPVLALPLPLAAVRLTGGPLKHAQELDAEYLLSLEPDRMLYYLRQRAGLPPKAKSGYGGWDGEGRQLTGHIAGHYLSAVSYMYAATGDPRFKERADYIVGELKEIQDRQGDGYLGALLAGDDRNRAQLVDGKKRFADLGRGIIQSGGFDLNGMWSPWYVQHKLFAGLRDAYRQTGNRTALDTSVKFAGWVESIVGGLDDPQLQRMLSTEFGGLNESLADLYADTGDARWLKLSQRFHHDAIVNPLANHQDILAGKHGNTNIPKVLGELVRYVKAGNAPDGEAGKFFWDTVVSHHTFATGGHGYDEAFGPADKLSDEVDGSGQRGVNGRHDLRTCESCNVYNMVKMTKLLFALQPDNKFAEFHERALFNHVLASISFDDGQLCYMVPVGQGLTHEYQGLYGMTCCCGTGLENHALHGFGLYYTSADKLWVNLYTPSTAEWKEQGARLETSVVNGDAIAATLRFTTDMAKEVTLALRRPFWAGDGFALMVNGEAVKELPATGTYAEIKRIWKVGDTVELVMPKALYKEPLVGNPNRVALKWGPYVLGADYGAPDAMTTAQAAVAATTAANSVGGGAGATGTAAGGGGRRGGRSPQVKYPVFLAKENEPVSNWLAREELNSPAAPDATTDEPVSWIAKGVGGDNNEVTFRPFYQLSGRRYGIYQDVYTAEEWQRKNAPPEPAASTTPA